MTPGEIIAVLALIGVAGLAIRSVWKNRRSGGACDGDCSRCGGCHHK